MRGLEAVLSGGNFMQDASKNRHGSVKKSARAPWIIRLLAALWAPWRLLAQFLWRFARKNVPLSLGIAMFLTLLALVSYNASFRQKSAARPVLFATRAAPLQPRGGLKPLPRLPFVERTFSTKALERQNRAISAEIAANGGQEPADSGKSGDAIAALIDGSIKPAALSAAAGASLRQAAGQNAPARERAAAAFADGAAAIVPEAKPHSGFEHAAAFAAPGHGAAKRAPAASGLREGRQAESRQKKWAMPSRDQVLRAQKALARAGQPALPATGVWDMATRAAVRRFQKAQSLPQSGQLDRDVIRKLRDLGLW